MTAARAGRSEIKTGVRPRRASAPIISHEGRTKRAAEVMDLNAMLDEALASLHRTVAMVDELSADMRRRNRVFLAVERRIERKNAANWRLLRELVGGAPGA